MADWFARNTEMRQLVTATEAANDAIDQWERARDEILAELPSAHFVTPELRQQAEQQIAQAAAQALPALTEAASAVSDISVRVPWHEGVIAARDAYVEYLDAWLARLQGLIDDPASFDEPATQIAAARSDTVRAFGDALPPMALFGLGNRVDALFTA